MPDITMCINGTCEVRNECYRYRAIPDYWQSKGFFDCGNKKHKFFIEIEGRQVRDTDAIFKISEEKGIKNGN